MGTAAVGAAVCALYMNCTVPTGDCTFMFGKLGDDGMFVPLSSLPQLNNDTHQLNSGRRATSGSSLFLPCHLLPFFGRCCLSKRKNDE